MRFKLSLSLLKKIGFWSTNINRLESMVTCKTRCPFEEWYLLILFYSILTLILNFYLISLYHYLLFHFILHILFSLLCSFLSTHEWARFSYRFGKIWVFPHLENFSINLIFTRFPRKSHHWGLSFMSWFNISGAHDGIKEWIS